MLNIDLWYDDKLEDITDFSCSWSDLDCVYRGNFYNLNKKIGDYTVSDSEMLRDIVPQCFEMPFC